MKLVVIVKKWNVNDYQVVRLELDGAKALIDLIVKFLEEAKELHIE